MSFENAIIIVNKTRLEQLIERFNTKAQARFYIEHSGGNFNDYELEHSHFKQALGKVQEGASKWLNCKVIDRRFLPNYIFAETDLILVIGQDGLVANTAKYAKGLPIIAVNPDPERFDGVLLPFFANNFEPALINTLEQSAIIKAVTMAQVNLQDGQRLLAFNDLFIGPKSHVSARYQLTHMGESERQSSSGIIVSTGAGSTGWLSSLFNMANGIYTSFGGKTDNHLDFQLEWETRKLAFVVREPFQSIYTGTSMTAGLINENDHLELESFMPNNGKIFSDGIEDDYLDFNSGAIAKIGLADEKANIVVA